MISFKCDYFVVSDVRSMDPCVTRIARFIDLLASTSFEKIELEKYMLHRRQTEAQLRQMCVGNFTIFSLKKNAYFVRDVFLVQHVGDPFENRHWN